MPLSKVSRNVCNTWEMKRNKKKSTVWYATPTQGANCVRVAFLTPRTQCVYIDVPPDLSLLLPSSFISKVFITSLESFVCVSYEREHTRGSLQGYEVLEGFVYCLLKAVLCSKNVRMYKILHHDITNEICASQLQISVS